MISCLPDCSPNVKFGFVEGSQPGVCKNCREYRHDHYRINEGAEIIRGGYCSPYGGRRFTPSNRLSGLCQYCGCHKDEHYNTSNMIIVPRS